MRVRLARPARESSRRIAYPPALARVLAELPAAAALLASTLKFEGSLIVQLVGRRSGAPARRRVQRRRSRCARRRNGTTAHPRAARRCDAATLAGGARRPPRAHARPEGRGTDLPGHRRARGGLGRGDDRALPRDVRAAARSSCWSSTTASGAGVLVQRLPASGRGRRRHVGARVALRLRRASPSAIVAAPARRRRARAAVRGGRRARVQAAHAALRVLVLARARRRRLRIAGRAEIESALRDAASVEVTCEFCNRRYTFAPAEARGGVRSVAAGTRHRRGTDGALRPAQRSRRRPAATRRS